METSLRTLALAALAPIAWGSGYYVTETYLPPDRPLFGAMVRALPFGLLLLIPAGQPAVAAALRRRTREPDREYVTAA